MLPKILSTTIAFGDMSLSAEIVEPANMKTLLVLAHGAGAGMHHSFMVSLSESLATFGIGTLRFNFPYMEKGSKRPDQPAKATLAVKLAIEKAHALFPDVPIIAGGKSFGGRMTSQCLAGESIPYVKAIVFYGFPLHPLDKPGISRADHLINIQLPMLFLQGTKDALAELSLIKEVCAKLTYATLCIIEGADHSFKIKSKDANVDLSKKTFDWLSASHLI